LQLPLSPHPEELLFPTQYSFGTAGTFKDPITSTGASRKWKTIFRYSSR
jgi:hypothetical protein